MKIFWSKEDWVQKTTEQNLCLEDRAKLTKPNLLNQIYQSKSIEPNLPSQILKTESTKLNLPSKMFEIKNQIY